MWWRWKRYPGFGPWSHLPPWERPGWKFGRGRCWWLFANPEYMEQYSGLSKEEELRMLEEMERYLEEELRMIRRRIKELRGER